MARSRGAVRSFLLAGVAAATLAGCGDNMSASETEAAVGREVRGIRSVDCEPGSGDLAAWDYACVFAYVLEGVYFTEVTGVNVDDKDIVDQTGP